MASVVVLPLLLHYLVFVFPKIRQSTFFDALFFIFIVYFLVIIIVNNGRVSHRLLIDNIATLIYLASTFLVFRGVNVESKKFYTLNTFFFLLISLVVILFSKDGVFILVVEGAGFIDNNSSYQFIAVIYVLSYFVFITRDRSWHIRYAFHLLAGTVLFLNGARSEFIGLVMIIGLFEVINSKNRLWVITGFSVLVSGLVTAIYLSSSLINSNNRVVDLLNNAAQNESSLTRINLTNSALKTIYENPFMGKFGDYESGHYAHNIFSVWVDLGFIGFVLYCVLLLIPFIYVSYLMVIKKRSSEVLIVLMCLIYISVLLVIFSKSFSYILPPAAFGLFSNYLSRYKISLSG